MDQTYKKRSDCWTSKFWSKDNIFVFVIGV